MKVEVVFEDDNLLVIDKPAGMVVNKAETTRGEKTVQDWAEQYLKVPRGGKVARVPRARDTCGTLDSRDTFFARSGIVHRLDKETTGLLLVAKTPESFANLQSQFKNRQVVKKYLSLVHGRVIPEEGEVKAPVGRLPWNRERFGVVPGGREAVTSYKVLKYYPPYSFLEIYPLTGRTHQIRVHLKYLGHPVVGDSFYAGRKRARDDRKFCPRVFLHASFLQFYHPETSKEMKLESPLPKDLQAVLLNLSR